MRMLSEKHTLAACCIGYITQSIVGTFAPLLFLTFRKDYGVSLSQLSMIVFLTFAIQLVMDALSVRLIGRISTRALVITAHAFSASGLICMAFLPNLAASPYAALLFSVCLYSIGGGLIEVLVSPIVNACPSRNNAALMSMLHSFFSWGQVLVVLVSTAFFSLFGVENWRWLALFWALVPALNTVYFAFVPIPEIGNYGDGKGKSMLSGTFVLLLILMTTAGAAEISVSQWASAFAERGLGISKTAGDLAGPCLFAAAMGTARVFYAKAGDRVDLTKFMTGSAALCILGYAVTALSPFPPLALAGCALCGLSVGIMWPGILSLAAKRITGSASMFAWLALAGDIGCTVGPSLVGLISQGHGDDLSFGILIATVFPIVMLICLLCLWGGRNRTAENKESHI